MPGIISFSFRNIRRYYRDKGALFFSLLSVFIIVVLYVLFLGDMQIKGIKSITGDVKGLKSLVDAWILGGLLCIPAVSAPLMMFSFKVQDAVDEIQDDFLIIPSNKRCVLLGYIISGWIVGIITTVITFLLGIIFMVLRGGEIISLLACFKIIGVSAILILTFSGFSFFVMNLLKSSSAVTIVHTIFNTVIGFLTGMFIPIGLLSPGVASVIKAFPLAHVTSLFRQVLMEKSMNTVFGGLPADTSMELRQQYGIDISIGGHILSAYNVILILVLFGIAFYFLSVLSLNYNRKFH